MGPIDRNRMHFVVVLHGPVMKEGAMVLLFHQVLELMEQLYVAPDKVEYDLNSSGNYVTYNRAKKKLEENLSKIEHFSLCSLNDGCKQTYEGYQCMIGGHKKEGRIICDFDIDIFSMNKDRIFDSIANFATRYGRVYGYGYLREFSRGPYYYAHCIKYGEYYPGEEERGVMMWFHACGEEKLFIKNAWIRDVYPWNWVTSLHLDAPVANRTLREWIIADPSRGTLSPAGDDMMLWEVPELQIPKTRQALRAAGRIFDFQRDIAPKFSRSVPEMSIEEATSVVLNSFGFDSPDEVEIRTGDNKPISDDAKKALFKKTPKK